MRDLLLQCSGVAAIAVALIHGVLGETKVFARATIEPPRLRKLIRLVWQAGTVAWIGGGVLLIAAPSMASEPARHWIIVTLAAVFAFAALANALAMRHPAKMPAAHRESVGGGGVLGPDSSCPDLIRASINLHKSLPKEIGHWVVRREAALRAFAR